MTRRKVLLALSMCGAGLGCGPPSSQPRAIVSPMRPFPGARLDAQKSSIVVFMPDTLQTREVWQGLSDELHEDFNLVPVVVPEGSSADVLARAINEHRPVCVVLMNNPTLAAYRSYQAGAPKGEVFPPAVIVMASFLEQQYRSIHNATGISYELPAVTVFSNLRGLLTAPIRRVGTIHRPGFGDFVQRQAELAASENITLVGVEVGASPRALELKWAIRELRSQVDAIWIQNDNVLLTPELISRAWIAELHRRPRLPTIVGAAPLVSVEHSFGTFAMLPDHTALGVQTAGLVFDLAEAEWQLAEHGVQLPLSTVTVMDLQQAQEFFELAPGALARVDRVLR